MPKETISTAGPYNVRVGWNQGGSLQVGVEATGERSLFWTLLGDQEVLGKLGRGLAKLGAHSPSAAIADDEAAGRALLDLLDTVSQGAGPNGSYQGIWSDLDRHDCNDLIRILRRARDAAHGRDE